MLDLPNGNFMPNFSDKTRPWRRPCCSGPSSWLFGHLYDRRENRDVRPMRPRRPRWRRKLSIVGTASADRRVMSNGSMVAAAVERYRTCQVVQPKGTTTSAAYGATQQTAQLGCTPAAAAPASSRRIAAGAGRRAPPEKSGMRDRHA